MTVDGEAQSRNTNLVLKGIVALKAMSNISGLLGQNDDSSRYSVRLSLSKLGVIVNISLIAICH